MFKRFLASTILCTTCCTDEWRKIKFNYNSNNSNNANGNQIASVRSSEYNVPLKRGGPKMKREKKKHTNNIHIIKTWNMVNVFIFPFPS